MLVGAFIVIINSSCNKSCITNCNTGALNEETCNCDCPSGFSGNNCETEDLCITQNVDCQNGGICVDGTCECPDGYTGTNCENCNASQVQARLDGGMTPIELFNCNVPLDSFYGKIYEGGLIFYLDTIAGTGLVAAPKDQSSNAEWGCNGMDIIGLNHLSSCVGDCVHPAPRDTIEGARIGDGKINTDTILAQCNEPRIAARLCRDLGDEWFLPARGELYLMYVNLELRGHGGFTTEGLYWSSTEFSFEWNNPRFALAFFQRFNDVGDHRALRKDRSLYVRAARAF